MWDGLVILSDIKAWVRTFIHTLICNNYNALFQEQSFVVHNQNFVNIYVLVIWKIMVQTSHNFVILVIHLESLWATTGEVIYLEWRLLNQFPPFSPLRLFSIIKYRLPILLDVHIWQGSELLRHCSDVIITSVSIVWSTVCSGVDQRKH